MAGIDNNFMTSIPYKNKSTSVSDQNITSKTTGKNYLEKDDFFKLLAAQLQNQDMTNPMDQSEFMNQLTMMSSIQAMEEITNVSVVSYAASLVGKDVTIGEIGGDGGINEIYGTVTGTGVYAGEQVVFVDGKSYALSQIMVVGKLPETDGNEMEGGEEDTEGDTKVSDKTTGSDSNNIGVDSNTDSTNVVTDSTNAGTDSMIAGTDSTDVVTDSTPSETDSSVDNA